VEPARLLTVTATPRDLESLGRAIDRERDHRALRDLVSTYSLSRDACDLETLLDLFTPEGVFEFAGTPTRGRAELETFYRGTMSRYRTTLHVTHEHLVDIGSTRAAGVVVGHGELALDDMLMLAAYRYDDEYVKVDDRWYFEYRRLRFMYTVPADQLATSFTTSDRIRWPGTTPRRASIPEDLPTFTRRTSPETPR
jgi:hypothetical protein